MLLLFPLIPMESLSLSGRLFSRHTMRFSQGKTRTWTVPSSRRNVVHPPNLLLVFHIISTTCQICIAYSYFCSRSSKLTLLFNCGVSFHFLNDSNNRALLLHPLRLITLSDPKSRSWTRLPAGRTTLTAYL